MTTANARIAIILVGCLMLGLGTVAERASAEAPAGFSQAELDQMLAPIALYPDTVLSHVLIAATYPLEVVQAARWSRANPGLEGEYAVAAVEHYPWDPSVMALVAFPELLTRMDADLEWTQRLGDAFLIQEYQVLETVQYLRDEAYASGHLRSNEYVRVVRETEYIYIEPSVTRVVYVPWYDPYTVYGNWRWSAYPPVYWHQPSGYRSGFSFHWGSGHRLDYGFFFSAVHWPSHRLLIHDHYGYYGRHDNHYGKRYGKHGYEGRRFTSGRELAGYAGARHWMHDPVHRRGVAYRRGIDERHALRASSRSDAMARNSSRGNGYNAGRDADHVNRRDSRLELLRNRARNPAVQTQRPDSLTAGSNPRNRQDSDRATRSRNSIRRDAGSILGVARSDSATSGRREYGAAGKTASQPRTTSERRRTVPNSASNRRELAQRRAPTARPASRLNSGGATTNRARGTRPQSSVSRSPSRSTPRLSQRSSQRSSQRPPQRSVPQARSAASSRAIQSRSRQPVDSVRSANRSSSRAVTRQPPRRLENRTRQAGTPSPPHRAKAPRQGRPHGARSRAEVLGSRGRDRRP